MSSLRWVDTPSTDRLAAANGILNHFARELIPSEPDAPIERIVSEIVDAPSYRRIHVIEAVERDEVVGAAELVLDDVVGRDSFAWVKALVVVPEHRRRHIGTAMFEAIVERSRQEARERLHGFFSAPHEAGSAFVTSFGGRTTGIVTLLIRVHTLDLDRAMLEGWVDRADEHADVYSLVRFDGPCPDMWSSQFAELATVMNTIPRSSEDVDTVYSAEQILERQKAHLAGGGWSWTVCVCQKPSMRLVGFTELSGTPHRPWLAVQGDTGVHPDHRNRGLSRWVKAVNVLRLLDVRPEVQVIESLNEHMNYPMLSINAAMGFRQVVEWVEWNRATS